MHITTSWGKETVCVYVQLVWSNGQDCSALMSIYAGFQTIVAMCLLACHIIIINELLT